MSMLDSKVMNIYLLSFGLAVAILILSVAFAVANKHYKFASQGTFIWLLILPLVVFGVASGLVKELTAPGGLGAKFGDVAGEPVSKSARTLPPVPVSQEDADQIAKGTPPNSPEIKALVEGQPIFLTLTLGVNFYTPNGLIDYIKFIMQKDKDLLVVFVSKNKFWAMADPSKLLLFLRDQTKGQNLIDAIKTGRALTKDEVPVLIFEPLQEDTSNAQALQTMVKNNLRAMVVVNKDNEPKAIAERDKIVAQLVTQLAASEQ